MNWSWLYGVPIGALLGIFLAAYWPFGKGPEGPPYYAGFSANDGHDHGGSCEDVHPYVSFDPPATEISKVNFSMYGEGLHSGFPCGPACWRKPDGHRWGDVH
jgi:hypothetical protein